LASILSSTVSTSESRAAWDAPESMCGQLQSVPKGDPPWGLLVLVAGSCLLLLWSILRYGQF
jgi:hypothetical protein